MAKKIQIRSFDEVLSLLGNEKFDVAAAPHGANGGRRVAKYGAAADIEPSGVKEAPVRVTARAGWLLGGEIARLTDRGYQKFLKTSKLEIPATADILRALHRFEEEFKEATGSQSLYNESLGTTSDRYIYDRVLGRQ